MSTLNLGLQSVGLMRQAGSEEFEADGARCNSLQDLRKAGERKPQFRIEALDSVAPVKVLLNQVFQCQQLKNRSIQVSTAVPQSDIDSLWHSLSNVFTNECPNPHQVTKKSSLHNLPELVQFMSHCCRLRHYFFEVKKCGEKFCKLCKPVRLPEEIFKQIKLLAPEPQGMAGGKSAQ